MTEESFEDEHVCDETCEKSMEAEPVFTFQGAVDYVRSQKQASKE